MPKFDGVEGEFTNEGAKMWNNIGNDGYFEEQEAKTRQAIGKRARENNEINKLNAELQLLRLEIQVLKQNSDLVLDACKEKMLLLAEQEDYRGATIQRLVGFLHKNFAMRLDRVLNGLPAIEAGACNSTEIDIDKIKL